MLHFTVYLRHVEGGAFRIDEDGRRISEKVKLVYSQENNTFGEKMELSEDYRCFTRDTTLTDRLTSSALWK